MTETKINFWSINLLPTNITVWAETWLGIGSENISSIRNGNLNSYRKKLSEIGKNQSNLGKLKVDSSQQTK